MVCDCSVCYKTRILLTSILPSSRLGKSFQCGNRAVPRGFRSPAAGGGGLSSSGDAEPTEKTPRVSLSRRSSVPSSAEGQALGPESCLFGVPVLMSWRKHRVVKGTGPWPLYPSEKTILPYQLGYGCIIA